MAKQRNPQSRTAVDANYKAVNKACMDRRQFIHRAAREYVETQHPEVMKLIEDEAYKRFPSLERRTRRRDDLSFLKDLPKSL